MNDQNQEPLTIEEKYQLYKLKQQNTQIQPQNHCEVVLKPKTQLEVASYIRTQANSEKVIEMLMGDPTLRELSENLKKRAQQKNKQYILGSFPERYQNLLEKENMCFILEQKMKKMELHHQQKILKTQQKTDYFQNELKEKQQEIIKQIRKRQALERKMEGQLCELVKKKEKQNLQYREQNQLLEHKFQKYKNDYNRASKVLIELREREQEHQKEQKRLISSLKDKEQKILFYQKKLLQTQQQANIRCQSLELQLQDQKQRNTSFRETLSKFQKQLQFRIQEKATLESQWKAEKVEIIQQYEQEQKLKHEELQEIRIQYLQSLQTIDMLEQKNEEIFNKKYEIQGQFQVQKTKTKTLQADLQSTQMKYEDLLSSIREQRNREQLAKTKYEGIQQANRELEKQMIKLMKKNEELVKQKASIQEKVKQVQLKNQQDFEKITQYVRETIQKSTIQCTKYKEEITTIKSQNEDLKRSVEGLEERISHGSDSVIEKDLAEFIEYYCEKLQLRQREYNEMKTEIQDWLEAKSSKQLLVKRVKNKEMMEIIKSNEKQLTEKLKQSQSKNLKLQQLVERLKEKTQSQYDQFYKKTQENKQIFEELLHENKMLKRKLKTH